MEHPELAKIVQDFGDEQRGPPIQLRVGHRWATDEVEIGRFIGRYLKVLVLHRVSLWIRIPSQVFGLSKCINT